MKAKLVKREDRFDLYDEQGHKIASTLDGVGNKLSLKNCQAIERGYDLDELALEAFELDLNCQGDCNNYYERLAWKLGFQKAIKLLGDKKFSEDNLLQAIEMYIGESKTLIEIIQSLQQTEWDVDIEMIGPLVYPANLPKEGEERPTYRPKLDADKCLILKRI
jgi:hypothetical protein